MDNLPVAGEYNHLGRETEVTIVNNYLKLCVVSLCYCIPNISFFNGRFSSFSCMRNLAKPELFHAFLFSPTHRFGCSRINCL